METQDSIEQWAAATFAGSDRTALGIATRMNIEVAELVAELVITNMTPERAALECADIWIVLAQVAHAQGYLLERGVAALRPVCNLELVATINTKSAELLSALQHRAPLHVTHALMSDIASFTESLCARQGMMLSEAVDRKMQVNRARSWKRTESGRMQHG